MRRYLTRPRSWQDVHEDMREDARPMIPHLIVSEDDTPRPTGLVDHHGHELVSVPVREPIGFVRFGEQD